MCHIIGCSRNVKGIKGKVKYAWFWQLVKQKKERLVWVVQEYNLFGAKMRKKQVLGK